MQQTPPADSLIQWKRKKGRITGQVVIVLSNAEVEACRGTKQGRQKAPDLQAVLKPAFNQHAVREPGASTRLLTSDELV